MTFGMLTYQWVTPIMIRGYQRPLQATDLWKMDESREGEWMGIFVSQETDWRQLIIFPKDSSPA